jgi:thiamine biosynthesis lipoprotein
VTRRTELVMGDLPFTVEVTGDVEPAIFDAVFADLRWVDRTFSPFIADSAVGRINAGVLREDEADPRVREVLGLCRAYETVTDGYFSAWTSGRLDPCGLVKGWAMARACAILDRAGHRSYFVDGAGDVRVRGERAPGRPWRVGIRHPVRRDRVAEVLAVTDRAVATSGTYERGPHIRDPHTGEAATELVSLTVVGPDIVAADVYATAAFAMGLAGLTFVEGLLGYEALAIDNDLFSASTTGFAELIAA